MNNTLVFNHPQQDIDTVIVFLRDRFVHAQKNAAVIAVSGGIDSALSLTLLTQALSASKIYPILLPYGTQNMDDAKAICVFNGIPAKNITVIDIKHIVSAITDSVGTTDPLRQGNIMARTRMIAVFDLAKQHDALVCGTENKSEHYLGYFTRFGDAASDLEPISHLYKTQVRQLAQFLDLPKAILEKNPSAGLWKGQTDEQELGFSYEDADKVLLELLENHTPEEKIALKGVKPATVQTILARVRSQQFKLQVPYTL